MPIKAPSGEVIGVAQVINKIGSKDRHEAFTDSDEKVSVALQMQTRQDHFQEFYA